MPAAAFLAALGSAPFARTAAADAARPGTQPVAPGAHTPTGLPINPYLKNGHVRPFPGGKWTGEPVVFEVDVVNPGPTAFGGSVSIQKSAGRPTAFRTNVSVNVPAGATQTVTLGDKFPVPRCLGEVSYEVWLQGDAQSCMDVKVNPTCTFAYTPGALWPHMDAQQVAAAKDGKLYYQNARVAVPPACSQTSSFTLAADVYNAGKVPAKGVTLTIVPPPEYADFINNPSIPFETDPGYPQLDATANTMFFSGMPGTYSLALAEQSGPPVTQPGYTVNVTQSCTVASSFVKPPEPFLP